MLQRLLYLFLTATSFVFCSKCPEPKKPDPTSCTIFYNCVNLPGGGYVWVPAKCTNGLVFQPYLRICVLPGDSWTCDHLSTESSLITNRYEEPELAEKIEESYLKKASEESLKFSEHLVDSSITTDDISEAIDHGTATPYPLIEFEKADTDDNAVNNNNSDEKSQLYNGVKENGKDKESLLRQLINRLLIYKEITIPLEALERPSLPDRENFTWSTIESENTDKSPHNILMNYLIQDYIRQNNLHNAVVSGARPLWVIKNATSEGTAVPTGVQVMEIAVRNGTINVSEAENSVVLVDDNAGNKRYITVDRYKVLSNRMNSQLAVLVPCVKNVRLLNKTDCTKYYTCDPETAIVKEYSCPRNTAFNGYARICEAASYEPCLENRLRSDILINKSEENGGSTEEQKPSKKICTELGKIKDTASDSHYYICYATPFSSEVKSIRMACPNGLIFCQTKKLCTIKRSCKGT